MEGDCLEPWQTSVMRRPVVEGVTRGQGGLNSRSENPSTVYQDRSASPAAGARPREIPSTGKCGPEPLQSGGFAAERFNIDDHDQRTSGDEPPGADSNASDDGSTISTQNGMTVPIC